MSTASTASALNGKLREQKGRGSSQRLRNQGFMPAVLYGQKDNLSLAVNPKELRKILDQKGKNALIDLSIEGDSGNPRKVLLKDYQAHPLRSAWVHVDFLEIDMTRKIRVHVPLRFVGVSAGEKLGGIANHVLRSLDVECLPADIPESIEVQMAEVQLGQAVHVSDLTIPANVKALNKPSGTVVSVQAEREEQPKPAEAVAAEGAAPAEAATAEAGKEAGKEASGAPAKAGK
ncbi:MAG: 50S ribosomal protein L25 [Nitrospinae bacterium]|nr:50S ribosomal protein L25 [Nitrospinota bacterium]